jgi:hypothetical protein
LIDPVFDFLAAPPLRLIASNQALSGSRLIKNQAPSLKLSKSITGKKNPAIAGFFMPN